MSRKKRKPSGTAFLRKIEETDLSKRANYTAGLPEAILHRGQERQVERQPNLSEMDGDNKDDEKGD